jgi:hypothetical protein
MLNKVSEQVCTYREQEQAEKARQREAFTAIKQTEGNLSGWSQSNQT